LAAGLSVVEKLDEASRPEDANSVNILREAVAEVKWLGKDVERK
jgi:hypothetical protein